MTKSTTNTSGTKTKEIGKRKLVPLTDREAGMVQGGECRFDIEKGHPVCD